MLQISSRCIKLFAGLILFFSGLAFSVNYFIYQFPGNNYFPDNVLALALLLILLNTGLYLYFPKQNIPRQIGNELIYFFLIMAIIALATCAVQLTPFPPIDAQIIKLESLFHINIEKIVLWTNQHARFKEILIVIYDSLGYQMSIIPLLVLFTCRFYLIREYYLLLLCSTFLGFGFYYFFPTTAPASIINVTLFSTDQIATGLKFYQLHHHINPTTNAGGLIALPSFHAIWAVLCVYLLREWPIPCILLTIVNSVLIASCVLLGWHYCTDIIGSIIILVISYYCLNACSFKKKIQHHKILYKNFSN